MRYIVTVNRDAIDKGYEYPIRVEDTTNGNIHQTDWALLSGEVVIKYGPARQDGARVWIECDGVEEV
jgi:hypothetical protein